MRGLPTSTSASIVTSRTSARSIVAASTEKSSGVICANAVTTSGVTARVAVVRVRPSTSWHAAKRRTTRSLE